MPDSYETLRLGFDDCAVARVTLSRPAVHNCMSDVLIADLHRAVATIEAHPGCRVAVLTAMLYDLNRLSKPLVGRIQGSAYGGGDGLVACCDVAFAAKSARFCLTEVTLGLVPANVSPYVARKMGEANARRTFFTGRVMSAEEAARMGLVTEAVEPAELDDKVEAEIRSILRCAPGAVAATKRLVDYVLRHDDATNRVYTADRLADAWETEEGKEGIRAFLEKRAPSWRPRN
jgi:methylglutaconyl-CoA hydratase